MFLKIKNIGKIESAEVKLDGITVIAGENNSGKSTVGKTLCAMFNSLHDLEEYVEQQRIELINKQLRSLYKKVFLSLQRYGYVEKNDETISRRYKQERCIRKRTAMLLEERDSRAIYQIIDDFVTEIAHESFAEVIYPIWSKAECDADIEETVAGIEECFKISAVQIACLKVTNVFNKNFDDQTINLNNKTEAAEVLIKVKGKSNKVCFEKGYGDSCIHLEREFIVEKEAFYIANPRAIERMEKPFSYAGSSQRKSEEERLLLKNILMPGVLQNNVRTIKSFEKEEEAEDEPSDVQKMLNQSKAQKVLKIIRQAMGGRFVYENGNLMYREENISGNINVSNMSTGLKSLGLLERVIASGLLEDKSVLVLDEPEINLHPEWQLLYAEVIVILQREFDLTIVISTHSPYFVQAISYYLEQYDRKEICHYYMAENRDGKAVIKDMDEDVDIIF